MDAQILVCRAPSYPPELDILTKRLPAPVGAQVLVEVEATAVNPIDVKRAAGGGRRLLSLKGAGRFPLTLGNDFAGVVRAVGPVAGAWRPGQRVYGLLPTGSQGAHASAVLVDARWLRPAPPGRAPESLATLAYSFTTVALSLRAVGLNQTNARGKRVLINGASGGLGRLALQVLVPWGARVVAVCSAPDVQACLDLGAEEVLDRQRQALTSLPAHVDASLNFGAWQDDAAMLARLKPDALGHATTVHPLLEHVDRRGWIGGAWAVWRDMRARRRQLSLRGSRARYSWITFRPDGVALDQLHALVTADAIALPVGLRVPLPEAAAAFAHVRERRAGRALLLPGAA